MTYFRIQSGDRDVTELLDPGYQFSHAWSGGAGYTREGVSTCETVDDLVVYLATPQSAGLPWRNGGWVLVEVEGDRLGGGIEVDEVLVRPTAIVAVTPLDDAFTARVDATAAEIFPAVEPDFDDDDDVPTGRSPSVTTMTGLNPAQWQLLLRAFHRNHAGRIGPGPAAVEQWMIHSGGDVDDVLSLHQKTLIVAVDRAGRPVPLLFTAAGRPLGDDFEVMLTDAGHRVAKSLAVQHVILTALAGGREQPAAQLGDNTSTWQALVELDERGWIVPRHTESQWPVHLAKVGPTTRDRRDIVVAITPSGKPYAKPAAP